MADKRIPAGQEPQPHPASEPTPPSPAPGAPAQGKVGAQAQKAKPVGQRRHPRPDAQDMQDAQDEGDARQTPERLAAAMAAEPETGQGGAGSVWVLAAAEPTADAATLPDGARDGDADGPRLADRPALASMATAPGGGASAGTVLALAAGLALAASAGRSSASDTANPDPNPAPNPTPDPGTSPSDPSKPSDPTPPPGGSVPLSLGIERVAGDGVVNASEKAAGVAVSGTTSAAAGQTVSVAWGGTTKTATVVAGSGGLNTWRVNFASAEVPADANTSTLSASVRDASGNSASASASLRIDTQAPTLSIAAVTGDNNISAAERAAGVQVSGSTDAEAGQTVSVVWGSTSKTATVVAGSGGSNSWSVDFASAEVPVSASVSASSISASVQDSAGNAATAASVSVVVAGTGSGGAGSSPAEPSNIVTGTVSAGALIAGHGLTVTLYKADGTVLQNGLVLTPSSNGGSYSFNLGSYTGPVLVRVIDADARADYSDEASASTRDLSAVLLAVGQATGTQITLNINPVTTLAAMKVLGVSDGAALGSDAAVAQALTTQAPLLSAANTSWTAAISAANSAVGQALGLVSITTTTPKVVAGGVLDAGSAEGQYGLVLAAFSGVDLLNNGNAQKTLNDLLAALTQNGTAGDLAPAAQVRLLEGADAATTAIKAAASNPSSLPEPVSVLSQILGLAYGDPSLSIDSVSADNILLNAEANSGAQLQGSCASGTTAFTLSLNGHDAEGPVTVNGSRWTYTLTAIDLQSLGADGAKYIHARSGGQSATRVFMLNTEDNLPSGVLFMPVGEGVAESVGTVPAAGLKVASVQVVDDGQGSADLDSNLSGPDAGRFELRSTGAGKADLVLKAGVTLDHETQSSYTVTVGTSGSSTVAGTAGSGSFTLKVLNVNEAPTVASALGPQSFMVGSANRTTVPAGTFAVDASSKLSQVSR